MEQSAVHQRQSRAQSAGSDSDRPFADQLRAIFPDRVLLQASQQERQQLDSIVTERGAATTAALNSKAATDTKLLTNDPTSETKPDSQPQTAIQQYQPSNTPLLNADRLVSAASAQASNFFGDTLEKTAGEDQFDVWPLVEPPFQEALHEVVWRIV